MKTLKLPKNTLILLAASATLLFTGCNEEANTAYNTGAVKAQNITSQSNSATPSTPTTTQTPAPAAPAADVPEEEAQTPAETPVPSKVSEDLQQEYLDLVNAARAETQDCGSEGIFDPAPALTWNSRLDNAAYEHSNDMAQSNTFSHTGSGTATDITAQDQALGHGSRFSDRIRNQGYTEYRTIGENIAAGYTTAEETVNAWLESDHHCANMMNPGYTEMGMVVVEKVGSDYGSYWSQEFGGK